MEWIKTVLPLIGVLIGWLLAESGKIFADKRQDKKKLKKLLFFLLELDFHFTRTLSIELALEKYFDILIIKMADQFGMDRNDPELRYSVKAFKPGITKLLNQSKFQLDNEKIEYLSSNIDKVLIDLAEIFPILAYELNGQHNIKERLNRVDHYFNEVKEILDTMPFDFKQWINPKLTTDLVQDLHESIETVAGKIDNKTLIASKQAIEKMKVDENDDGMSDLIDDYFEKIIITIQEGEQNNSGN